MKHRGEILQKRFEESQLKFVTVRQALGVSHNTIKNWFLMEYRAFFTNALYSIS